MKDVFAFLLALVIVAAIGVIVRSNNSSGIIGNALSGTGNLILDAQGINTVTHEGPA